MPVTPAVGRFVMVAVLAAAVGGVRSEAVINAAHRAGALPAGKILVVPEASGVAGKLEVARLDGSKRRVLATLPGVISGAAWSPRGDRVAVSFRQGGRTVDDSFVLDSGGRIVAKMRGTVMAGSWSADGKYLVTDASAKRVCTNGTVVKRRLHLLVYAAGSLMHEIPVPSSPLSGRTRSLAESVGSVAWSPTGARLAYVISLWDCGNERAGMGPSTLYVTAAKGGKQTTVAKPAAQADWAFIGSPAWAPDGRSLAFPTRCLDGANGMGCKSLVVAGSDGRNARVVKRDANQELTNSVLWPTTNTLVFGRIRANEGSGIATIDLRTNRQRWLVRARSNEDSVCDDGTLELSADARYVVSNAWNSWPTPQIVVARLDGSQNSRTPYSVGENHDVADAYVP